MKRTCAICILCLMPVASCQEEKKCSSPVMIKPNLPTTGDRAAVAANNVRPALKKDLQSKGLVFGDPIFIRSFKEERVLELFVRNRKTKKFDLFRTYQVAAASGKLGPKIFEGDEQVPEGFYSVPPDAMNPNSQFHLSFNIGYPNKFDRHHDRTGSAIMIHGNQVSIGCLAMTDQKIEEIYTLCDAAHHNGQSFFRVHIFPFRMTDKRMKSAVGSEWEEFWKNLKEGYDRFENTHLPPDVNVENGRYTFNH